MNGRPKIWNCNPFRWQPVGSLRRVWFSANWRTWQFNEIYFCRVLTVWAPIGIAQDFRVSRQLLQWNSDVYLHIFISILLPWKAKSQRVVLLGPGLIAETLSHRPVPSNGGWQEMTFLWSELTQRDKERPGDSQQHLKDREKERGQQEMALMSWVMPEDGKKNINPTEKK